MKASIASMLKWLVLPWGKTSGRRMVLDGQSGSSIQIYNDSDALVAELGPEVNSDGNAPSGLWTRGFQFPENTYSFLGGGILQFGTVNASAISTRANFQFSVITNEPRSTSVSLASGAPLGTSQQARLTLTSTDGGTPRAAITGILSATSHAYGSVVVSPVADSPTSVAITGLSVAGDQFYGYATANTSALAVVREVSVTGVSGSGMTVWIYSTSETNRTINWQVIGVE